MMQIEVSRKKVEDIPFWWHSIDLGNGLITSGHKSVEILREELKRIKLPDLRGKTVLDIGAWDGFFSFEAERRGASRVIALDHYVWNMDIPGMMQYWRVCKQNGMVPKQYHEIPKLWRPLELPGKRGFDTAKEILNSKVESRIADIMVTPPEEIGVFDVVLFMGVLYHMQNPFEALKRVARLTRKMAIIETEAVAIPGYENHAFCEFYETNELNADVSNWWAPNAKALVGLCQAAGFERVELTVGRPVEIESKIPSLIQTLSGRIQNEKSDIPHYRAVVQAWKPDLILKV